MLDKIALGTAQFGMKYGISNKAGKASKNDAFNILESAGKSGIRMLDTAHSYGDSEDIIGSFINKSGAGFDIVSKLPRLNSYSPQEVERYCRKSLERLGQAKIYGYLVHSFENLTAHKELWGAMESLKAKGLVDKIGVSIYKPEELEYLRKRGIRFDILQAPYNVFDQRFEGYLSDLKKKGVEIHARSVFLQGLFFLKQDEINNNFQSAKGEIEKLHRISTDYRIPVHSICLCFALLNPLMDKIIIGVDSKEQLEQSVDSIEYLDNVREIHNLLRSLKFHDEEVILPYNWRL